MDMQKEMNQLLIFCLWKSMVWSYMNVESAFILAFNKAAGSLFCASNFDHHWRRTINCYHEEDEVLRNFWTLLLRVMK